MKLESWGDLYEELCLKAQNIPGVQWMDLWHNQVGFLVEEHPFPTPALFFQFRILSVEGDGENVQELNLQVDMYYFYETFLDTFNGAYNQADALQYLNTLTDIYKVFHGSSGDNYTEMTRSGFRPVDTGSAGNLYVTSFACRTIDFAGIVNYEDVIPGELDVTKGSSPMPPATDSGYLIP